VSSIGLTNPRWLWPVTAGVALLCSGCQQPGGPSGSTRASSGKAVMLPLPRRDAVVHLAPLGPMPASEANMLRAELLKRFPLKVEVLPKVDIPQSAYDASRGQLVAQELIETLRRANAERLRDSRSVVIGLTLGDIYTRDTNWKFAFSISEGNIGVVSTLRMDPVAYGKPVDLDLTRTRLRKMVMKRIGQMVYNLPDSPSPRSFMYSPILSLDDLDNVTESL
jgi:predicted Zn-dependent protease